MINLIIDFYKSNQVLIYILLFCAVGQGLFKDLSDALMSGKFQTKFNIKDENSFFGINSWTRKWKNGNKNEGEKYLFSSSIFVWLTDGWHFFNACQMICNVLCLIAILQIIFGLLIAIIISLIFWFIRSGTHHIIFTFFFRTKN
jgi:hypothetical protein